ncbi:MAG: hypothetical protein JXR18_14575 [Neptuniibacter sp.]
MKLITGFLTITYCLLLALVIWPFIEESTQIINSGLQICAIAFFVCTLLVILKSVPVKFMKAISAANFALAAVVIIGIPIQSFIGDESFWSLTEKVVAVYLLGIIPAFTATYIWHQAKET